VQRDEHIAQLPSRERVVDYFRWRAEDAHRSALNAHCYRLLRRQGYSARAADAQIAGLSIAAKNDLPAWQKCGVGLGGLREAGGEPRDRRGRHRAAPTA
jgi:tRNA(His) guanylyltransferase